MSDRIVVTGANGFVGRQLAAFAAAQGWEVAGIVRSARAEDVVRDAGGRPHRIPELTVEALLPALAGARAVVHLAGISAERAGATYEAVNLEGTRRVAQAARRAGVPRVIFFSGLGVARYGQAPRSTNGYFLSKLAAEADLFRSGLEIVALRPSYVIGPGSELVPALVDEMRKGEVERIGDGSYRMQPIAAVDVAEAVLACARKPSVRHAVVDTVGPEVVTYAQFIERVAASARRHGKPGNYRVREISIEEADRQAAAGGYRGLLPDELDVLLCDEVSDSRAVSAALGRSLTPLDAAIDVAVRAT